MVISIKSSNYKTKSFIVAHPSDNIHCQTIKTILTDAFIITMEADTEQRYHWQEENHRSTHIFVRDDSPVFHRTRYLNKLLNLAKTDIVGIWDTDVILGSNQTSRECR